MLIVLFLVSHINSLFVPCGRLSWLPVSFLLHVKYTLSYRIVALIVFLLCVSVLCAVNQDIIMLIVYWTFWSRKNCYLLWYLLYTSLMYFIVFFVYECCVNRCICTAGWDVWNVCRPTLEEETDMQWLPLSVHRTKCFFLVWLTCSLFYQVPISWSRLWLYLDVSMSSFIFSLPCLRLIFSLMSVSHIIVSWIVYPVFEITKIIFILTFIFMLILFTLYFFVCRPTLADPVFCCGWGGSIDAEGA